MSSFILFLKSKSSRVFPFEPPKISTNLNVTLHRQVSKSAEYVDPLASSNILDSLLYLTSSIGIKWLAWCELRSGNTLMNSCLTKIWRESWRGAAIHEWSLTSKKNRLNFVVVDARTIKLFDLRIWWWKHSLLRTENWFGVASSRRRQRARIHRVSSLRRRTIITALLV